GGVCSLARSLSSARSHSLGARSSTFTSRQVLVFDSGRHCSINTRSPSFESLFSSCACSLVRRLTYLPYTGCRTRRSICTVIVLCILLLTTRPLTERAPGPASALLVSSFMPCPSPAAASPCARARYYAAPCARWRCCRADRWPFACAG